MIPPPLFSAVSFALPDDETAEFLSEIKERYSLKPSALSMKVVG